MVKYMKQIVRLLMTVLLGILFLSGQALADTAYTRDAILMDGHPYGDYPGVYSVAAVKGDRDATLGISSISKDNLNAPTKESPAIVMGAAVPYEKRTGMTTFTRIDGKTLYAPYSYFRYSFINEQGPDGTTHTKLSGFDGSYVIIRVDVSNLIEGASEDSFLHVKQEGNAALMVTLGQGGSNGAKTFSDAAGNKSGVYPLAENAKSLKDTEGSLRDKPYIDVILMSSGTLVAGADTGTTDPTQITADFKLEFYVDQTEDYDPDLGDTYTPGSGGTTTPTLEQKWINRYYNEEKMPAGTTVTSYTVKGSDLELEVVNEDENTSRAIAPEYWSLRKALAWTVYNNSPIKMICEVPVLEGLLVDGTDYMPGNRIVIFDVNSFDIQIANHQSADAAALTVKNATLQLQDHFNTTGAELAVGNNARMSIQTGGILIIDQTCQLEVEYDAASTTPPAEGEPAPSQTNLDSGIISIEDGGKIINNGVLTIEGTEGKPIDPATPTIRDKKDAVLNIMAGGTLENNGCLLSYGELYCMGTIVNNGKYTDVIASTDPDKGGFTYHKGIQISWKDDVTQDSVYMGHLYVGMAADGTTSASARLENSGDIVMVPGIFECYGTLVNSSTGNIYLCPVEEAIIPIKATVDQPLIREKRVKLGTPMKSYFSLEAGGNLQNAGTLRAAEVEIVNNGRTGTLTSMGSNNRLFKELYLSVLGTAENSGDIFLDSINVFGEMSNTGTLGTKVVISSNTTQEGVLVDSAATKITDVFNGALTVDGNTNTWRHAQCKELNITPATQTCAGGTTPAWTATPKTDTQGENIRYRVVVYSGNTTEPVTDMTLTANTANNITGPALPYTNGNVLYRFYTDDGTNSVYCNASVTVSSDHTTPPESYRDLIYNGQNQALVTTGGNASGELEYRLGENGSWSSEVPVAKNAGTYTVFYRIKGKTEVGGSAVVVIGPRPVTVSAVDVSSPVGAELTGVTYTVSGIVEGESLNGISVSTNADKSTRGIYTITASVSGDNPNYAVTTNNGSYTVTEGLVVTAKDKYGVFSDELTYKGYNIEVTAPSTAEVYYREDTELTDENYQSSGYTSTTIPDLPAGAGTHIVYYYIKSGNDVVKGSKRVIIEKAQQKAPENLITRAESYKDSGDGIISGLVPREMEYRKADNNGTYTTAYTEKVYVTPGIYLVRRIADNNHYHSPDCVVTVGAGESITIDFDSDGGSAVDSVTDIAVGDTVPKPLDPVWKSHKFNGWYHGEELFDFDRPVTMSIILTAHWEIYPPHAHDMTYVEEKDPTCTENGNAEYYICSICGLYFEDGTGLVEIKYPQTITKKALGHKWDKGEVTTEPTETGEGIRTYTCQRDSSHTKTEAIPATGKHSMKKVEARDATCTEDGNIEYYECSGCGRKFWDAEGHSEITDDSSVVIEAYGHEWDKGIVTKHPSRYKDGVRTFTCLRNTGHTKTEIIPATGDDDNDDYSKTTSGTTIIDKTTSSGHTGAWNKDINGWHYLENGKEVKDSWRRITYNGTPGWYYFDGEGTMKTGWFDWNGSRYYLNPFGEDGRMFTGWHMIDGKWYYFETVPGMNQGHLYVGGWTPDGFYVNPDGSWDGKPAHKGA